MYLLFISEQMYSQSKEEASIYKRLYEEQLAKDSKEMDSGIDHVPGVPLVHVRITFSGLETCMSCM
jgi:hypothetical protein